MDRKQQQNEWKKEQRRLNTPYAQKQRESKRTEDSKVRRRELRKRLESKLKEKLYQREYRKRPDVIMKAKARGKARWALIKGILSRPFNCELCGKKDIPLFDGRSGLRMDHYLGYDEENCISVKFICVECDGKQFRKFQSKEEVFIK